jgi:hypothetical protein
MAHKILWPSKNDHADMLTEQNILLVFVLVMPSRSPDLVYDLVILW